MELDELDHPKQGCRSFGRALGFEGGVALDERHGDGHGEADQYPEDSLIDHKTPSSR
ncbi:hypothetical protein ITJ42_15700 [Clavibacter michiganensis subsp. phaseoli]|uniref:Uncharacterized protein n=1 Tax=Clavibacter phaseoli TaxID=1734031 RepID=A0A8I0S9M5_9MICO|nr:hypothetical protein [Clavibacter phaseoli]MBF4632664.1 hypothetical protein [Clavibacter phaseoli]